MVQNDPLIVESVHFYEKDNAKVHRTINFEVVHEEEPTPVLRRGQLFNIAVRFNRKFDSSFDIVRLLFNFGTNPNVHRGTQGRVNTRDSYLEDLEQWTVRFIGASETDISLEVRSPVDSPVGVWSLDVETTIAGSRSTPRTFKYEKEIYLLFNPWVKEDLVCMEDQKLLGEYVLTDVGKVWVGTHTTARGQPWVFGQFDRSVLPACMLALYQSGLKDVARGDPIKVSRALSRVVNSADGIVPGVLHGRWVEPYDDGVFPGEWTGSVPILEQYLETKKCVRYAQCWVFAGVLTTVCRALGIPSRVVTNFVSAHDTNGTLSVDQYYGADNKPAGTDSVWNFHVWNDAWMARPDLPSGYGGWQAIDATPQEASDGLYQCGPASVEAMKQGHIGFNYDMPFVLAEVNADFMRWKLDENSENGWKKIESIPNHIGRLILTKAPFVFDPRGEKDRQDVTTSYKSPEGTRGERVALLRAVRSISGARRYFELPSEENHDVTFELVDIDKVNIGQKFTLIVKIINKSSQKRTIKAELSVGSIYYHGPVGKMIKRAHGEFVLQPKAHEEMRLTATEDDYFDKLVGNFAMMKLYANATVIETDQTWIDEDDFEVLKPKLKVEAVGKAIVKKPTTVVISFANPLKRELTECQFRYSGPGLARDTTVRFRNIRPHEQVRTEIQVVPQWTGTQTLVAKFNSKELNHVDGSAVIPVARR